LLLFGSLKKLKVDKNYFLRPYLPNSPLELTSRT
jgi:hypothetical protein